MEIAIWHRIYLTRNSLLLLNLKICYCGHKGPQINPIVSQFTSSQPICLRFTLIFLIHAKDSMHYLNQKFQCISHLPCVWHVMDNSPCLTAKNIRQRIQITVWKSSLSSSFCSSVISPPLSHEILSGTLFSNTVNFFFPQCVRTSCTTINSGHFIFPSIF